MGAAVEIDAVRANNIAVLAREIGMLSPGLSELMSALCGTIIPRQANSKRNDLASPSHPCGRRRLSLRYKPTGLGRQRREGERGPNDGQTYQSRRQRPRDEQSGTLAASLSCGELTSEMKANHRS